jgi:hypothetical protein
MSVPRERVALAYPVAYPSLGLATCGFVTRRTTSPAPKRSGLTEPVTRVRKSLPTRISRGSSTVRGVGVEITLSRAGARFAPDASAISSASPGPTTRNVRVPVLMGIALVRGSTTPRLVDVNRINALPKSGRTLSPDGALPAAEVPCWIQIHPRTLAPVRDSREALGHRHSTTLVMP